MQDSNLKHKKLRKKALIKYREIGVVKCPIFNDEVINFNSRGFNHLVRKGRMVRPIKEQQNRFYLIKFAKKIIQKPPNRTIVEFEQRSVKERVNKFGNKKSIKKPAKFWTINYLYKNILIKLVIIQVLGRNKEFLSIMSRDLNN